MRTLVRTVPLTALLVIMYATSGGRPLSAQKDDPIAEARRLQGAGQYAAAAAALTPYLAQHPDDAGTHWYRAQLLYWSGSRTAARNEYELALLYTPPQDAAADSLKRYIADLSNGWVSINAAGASDDQPLRSVIGSAQAGRYFTSNTALFVDIARSRYTTGPGAAAGPTETGDADVTAAQLGMRTKIAALSLGGAAGGEQMSRAAVSNGASPAGRSSTWLATANAWAMLGMPRAFDITIAAARSAYHHTLSSMDSAIRMNVVEAGIERTPTEAQLAGATHSISGRFKAVAGRAALRRESFNDDNSIGITYGWILLPIVGGLRAGYAADFRDAVDSRWDGAVFDPYYTPENVRVHSVIADWGWRDFRRAIHVSGAAGVSARELAPFLLNPSGKQFGYRERSFTPWSVSASGTLRTTWRSSITAQVKHSRTAFYDATTMQIGTTLLLR